MNHCCVCERTAGEVELVVPISASIWCGVPRIDTEPANSTSDQCSIYCVDCIQEALNEAYAGDTYKFECIQKYLHLPVLENKVILALGYMTPTVNVVVVNHV